MTQFFVLINMIFTIVIGVYFWNLLKNQRTTKTTVDRETRKELVQLQKMRSIQLSEPLAEKTRPRTFHEIVGQEDGIKALRAALCGPNPQHVLIYGPPGVGKTAAARVVLEEAKKSPYSPFQEEAKFVELDATTARFDERGIADPLIGSVHDPIYQGAGAMGQAGIPQPKPGAVTKAHGGILFIDEIGELHPIQMNKLLKVLEDRKVILESAYYSEENPQIPRHIHDIFQNGLPADFRLVGATTRTPDEIPPAIRSRCMEIFFRPLYAKEIDQITEQALERIQFSAEEGALAIISQYAHNGREAINVLQLAGGVALTENRNEILCSDIEWVVHSSQKLPRYEQKINHEAKMGIVNGLAVYGPNMGAILEVEAIAIPVKEGTGRVEVTGVVEEETIGAGARKLRRKSMARGSLDNVLTVIRQLGLTPANYDIHLNFTGGMPIDGPSAGITMVTAIYSAIQQIPVSPLLAMTGEVSIHGQVKPVGGIIAKVEAARRAGARKVLIPKENYQTIFQTWSDIEVLPVSRIDEVIHHSCGEALEKVVIPPRVEIISVSPSIHP
ncbi:ATP-dependent protease LonB [Rubeoparvulum massiliense]|uniref:ATP-dependent protease LonB n=1 Tax=Rubeoparvulum massiliense TaxID=1631346 RepID=UPI000A457B7A|nr:ATP-dependent protease LonB [Rubeoparvulum massiliense]